MSNKAMEFISARSCDERKDARSGYGRMAALSLKNVGVRPL